MPRDGHTRSVRALLLLSVLLPSLPGQQPAPGLRDLPVPRQGRAVLFSSRDPSGGNDDHGHYLATFDDGRRVLAACRGPGRITRIWSANPTGSLRIELDGRTVWDGPFAALLAGAVPGFRPPLVGRGTGGGWLSYAPLPFVASCVVRAVPDDPGALYYQVGVELRPESATFDPDHPNLFERDTWALLDPGFPRDQAFQTRAEVELTADTPLDVLRFEPATELVELRVTLLDRPLAEPDARRVWLEVWLTDQEHPSIAAPIGDLLGVAFDRGALETLPVHGLGDTRVLRLPMPFATGAVLRLVPVEQLQTPLRFHLDAAWRRLPDGHARLPLRAGFSRAVNQTGIPFEVLTLRDGPPGHYVGAHLAMAAAAGQGVTFLEGDEAIAVDGEDPPAIQGTGTEDDLNGAWYFRGGTFGAPWHGLATLDERRGRVAVARFRGPDPVPFHHALTVRLEHGGQNNAPGSDYAAVAFWYGGPAPSPVPPTTRRTWAAPQVAPAPVDVVAEARLTLDPDDPAHACLRDRDLLIEVPGRPPRVTRIPADGLPLDLPQPTTVRLSPWLPSLRAFRVVGPFRPSAPRSGVDDVFGPERDPSPDAVYDDVAGDGPRTWRELPPPGSWTGYIDLNPLFTPDDEVVAYAACTIVSPIDQDATLILGSDDAVKVFLDGREVHRKVVLRGSGRDQDHVPVRLRAGGQLLLIKVEDYLGGFGFHARFEGAKGLEVRLR